MTPDALGLVLASALIHAVWSAAIKRSGEPLAFNLLQGIAPSALAVGMLPFVELGEIPGSVWRLLAATAFAHALYLYWMSRAYEQGDLTLVYPIARSTPAFLPLVAVPLLGEEISLSGAAGIAIVVAGIWLMQLGRGLRWAALHDAAAGFALLTLSATVAYSLFDKRAMSLLAAERWTSPIPRAVAFCLLLFLAHSILFAPLVLRRIGARGLGRAARVHLPRASAAAGVSLAGYSLALEALRTAPVSYVVAIRQASVLFALCIGVFWLGERPDRARVLGALATVAGVGIIALSG